MRSKRTTWRALGLVFLACGSAWSCGGRAQSESAAGEANDDAGGTGGEAVFDSGGTGGQQLTDAGGTGGLELVSSGGSGGLDIIAPDATAWDFAAPLDLDVFSGSCRWGELIGDVRFLYQCREDFDGDPDEGLSQWCGHLLLSPEWAEWEGGDPCPRIDELIGACVDLQDASVSYVYEDDLHTEVEWRNNCEDIVGGTYFSADEL